MHQIVQYPFALSDLLGSLDLDPTDRINEGEKLTGVLGFRRAILARRAEVDVRRGSRGS
jgi:hypothetical protein